MCFDDHGNGAAANASGLEMPVQGERRVDVLTTCSVGRFLDRTAAPKSGTGCPCGSVTSGADWYGDPGPDCAVREVPKSRSGPRCRRHRRRHAPRFTRVVPHGDKRVLRARALRPGQNPEPGHCCRPKIRHVVGVSLGGAVAEGDNAETLQTHTSPRVTSSLRDTLRVVYVEHPELVP